MCIMANTEVIGLFINYLENERSYSQNTSKSYIDSNLKRGEFIVCDLDVQGTDRIKELYGDSALAIFIEPPSLSELRSRLLKRGTDELDVINLRIKNAEMELKRKSDFDYLVRNENFSEAIEGLEKIFKEITQS